MLINMWLNYCCLVSLKSYAIVSCLINFVELVFQPVKTADIV